MIHAKMLLRFSFEHLPEKLQQISKPFAILAIDMANRCPHSHEMAVGLRKLLEAKDCAVRAALEE